MKTSVTTYSFHRYVNAGKMTQFDCIAKAKELGFDGIEFTEIVGANLEEQKENARKYRAEAERVGIDVVSYTISADLYKDTKEAREAEVERLKGELDIAALLGAKLMRHDVCHKLGSKWPARSFDGMLPYLAESARKVTEYAQTLGIRTCSENHGYIAQDSDRVERLVNAVHHDNYGLLVDIGNFICVDEDTSLAVSRVAPYAFHVHVKDFMLRKEPVGPCVNQTRGANYFAGVVIGEGDIPVKHNLAILKRAGYEGYLTVEYEGTEDCIAGVSRGLANLKNILKELDW